MGVKQLRLLQVSAEPILLLGGVGRIVQGLIGDLSDRYRISLATPDAESPDVPEGVVSCLEKRFTIPQTKWDPASRRKFFQQLEAGQYDLIHFHGGIASYDAHLPWRSPLHRLSVAGKVPWMISNHCAPSLMDGLFPPGYSRPAKAIKTALTWLSHSFLLTSCKQIVFDSRENEGQIRRCFPWAKSKMSTIYHSGLDGVPPRPVFAPEVVTIGYLGHFARRKGQQDLLAAFAQLHRKIPRLRLILAGPDGGDGHFQWVGDEIKRLKLEAVVSQPGGLNDKKAFWEAVDVYVQPSHSEGAPLALMEALWLGKPSIGTKVSGIPEIIQNNLNGLLVEARQPAELAAAIERLVIEPDTRRRLGENGAAQILARGMTRRQMSENYANLYTRILAGNRPSR